jgi:hypothetical protein
MGTHIAPALLFEFPEILNVNWGEVVESDGDETPRTTEEVDCEFVQFA